jgi:FAD binding domain
VQVVLRHADGAEEVARTDWLIGCDGASSMVRHLLGVSFVGRTFEQSFVTGDVRIQWDFPPDGAHLFISHGTTIGFFPMPEAGYYRVVITYRPGEGPQGEPGLPEIQCAISTYARAGVQASDPIGLARFSVNQRRVGRPVSGRVILAGDASHIHTFVGAQGMNAGIQDAFNLGWKLALVVRGKAAAHLLESYGQERGHVSKALLAATGLGARLTLLQQPLLTGVRDFMAPRVSALPWTEQRLIKALAGLRISYRDSSIVQDERLEGGRDRARLHAGDRAPDGKVWTFDSNAPHQLFELLSGTRHTLLVFSQPRSTDLAALARFLPAFQDLIESYQIVQGASTSSEQEEIGKKLYDPDGSLARRYGLVTGGLVLIRPDGYIGFRSRAIEGEHLRRYLHDLFATVS